MDEKIPLVRGWVTFPLEKAEELTHFRLGYSGHLPPEEITNVEIDLHSICQLNILLSYPDAVVRFGSGCSGRFNITCYRSARVEIGADVTANGLSLMVDDGEVTIGDDCMLAEVFIHAGDNHALFDTQTRGILNNRRALVSLEKHVWVASRATLLGGTRIGQGSIVAATATAKGNFGPCVLLAGVPAKVIKSNISWTRSPTGEGLDEVLKALDGAPR